MRRTREDTVTAQTEMEAHKIIKAMRLYLGMTQKSSPERQEYPPDSISDMRRYLDMSLEGSSQRFVRC